jgi:hypothetical protein
MAVVEKTIVPRDVTDGEVAHFHEHGWVKLDQLISEADAGVLLERLKAYMGEDASRTSRPGDGGGQLPGFHIWTPLSVAHRTGNVADELFYGFSHSAEMGRLGRKMLGGSVRYWINNSLVKMPAGQSGSAATGWHQDIGAVAHSPYDPPIQLNCWLSLAHNTPESGTMRFVSGKDVTDEVREIVDNNTVEESLPLFEALGIVSEPVTMRPGDASCHRADTLHGAPANTTSQPRWAHDQTMMPADTRFSGTHFFISRNVAGVEPGKRFPDHRFPIIG